MDLIIGAGVSGLSYANFCGHEDYLIVDKDAEIGGYCKTIKKNGFVWDYSGHFFHFRNKDIEKYLVDNIGAENIVKVDKRTQIKYKDRYIDFPFQKNIHQLSKDEFIDCLYDLFFIDSADFSNFKEMLYSKFGKSIAEKFLIPYNEKLYACDLNSLDKDAMGRFFPFADKEAIIKNFKQPDNNSYNSHFTYPTGGAIEYVNSLYQRVNRQKVKLNTKIVKIDIDNKIAYTDIDEEIQFDRVISSIPFPKLLELTQTKYEEPVYSWNKVLVYNLGFDKKGDDTSNHWVYFPEKKYCFYRIGYYDNILAQDRMSLYVELGFEKSESVDEEKYLKKVIEDLKKANIITDQKLIDYHSVVMDPAYVHINSNSIKDVEKQKLELQKHGIYSIGRYGSWTYCSIEDNIIEAKDLISK
jgi:protoporphyrinogen oxidase